jgi:hypothetical protein
MAKRTKAKPNPPRSSSSKKAPTPLGVPPAGKRVPSRLRGIAMSGGECERPVWRLSLLDRDYDDGWSWRIDEATLTGIISFLSEMERLTWREIWAQQTGGNNRRGAKHKFIPVDSLCDKARRRLEELELDEFDRLFRFRMGNMERLWGVLSDETPRVFYPIWWDPDHVICPSGTAR